MKLGSLLLGLSCLALASAIPNPRPTDDHPNTNVQSFAQPAIEAPPRTLHDAQKDPKDCKLKTQKGDGKLSKDLEFWFPTIKHFKSIPVFLSGVSQGTALVVRFTAWRGDELTLDQFVSGITIYTNGVDGDAKSEDNVKAAKKLAVKWLLMAAGVMKDTKSAKSLEKHWNDSTAQKAVETLIDKYADKVKVIPGYTGTDGTGSRTSDGKVNENDTDVGSADLIFSFYNWDKIHQSLTEGDTSQIIKKQTLTSDSACYQVTDVSLLSGFGMQIGQNQGTWEHMDALLGNIVNFIWRDLRNAMIDGADLKDKEKVRKNMKDIDFDSQFKPKSGLNKVY
ncbi:hypothetical protein CXG81DRAFT_20463 [Caulochytrium protostelioides]|uniref:Uncharacterized protein n=1 Tax=Caulochytrium protostelioides TaxID=1555241 RepID=A0A4P9X0K1_9FUNG|nr:hypothetical protein CAUPRSCDRAFT_11138 [Caulochytrium protostelioides]RKO99447.1 hypothetical protein CXG81DRAFT_20463 [Caulochytrium protostelioides]|eukprot:RKO99447.1 hypothetical protein CXG81DRAFT_20463 [Caulochytrium protostelioides]